MRAAYEAEAAEAWDAAAAWACSSHGSGGGCACGCGFFAVVASVVEVRKKGTVWGGIAMAAERVRGAGEHGGRPPGRAPGRLESARHGTRRPAVPRRDVAHVGAVRRGCAPDEVEVGLAVPAQVNFLRPKSGLSGAGRDGVSGSDLRDSA